jgi:hypothetical protein
LKITSNFSQAIALGLFKKKTIPSFYRELEGGWMRGKRLG